jgi:hypothetical protein
MKINRLMQVVFLSSSVCVVAPAFASVLSTGQNPVPSCGDETDEDDDEKDDEDGETRLCGDDTDDDDGDDGDDDEGDETETLQL